MKKHFKIILCCLLFSVIVIVVSFKLWESGAFVTDYSAIVGVDSLTWNGTYITEDSFVNAVSKIEAEKITSFTYETDGIFQLTENQHMRSLYFAYENCPVATNFIGYMGKVNGEWVITTDISQERNEDGSPKTSLVSCYVIPNEYWDIISKHFS